MICFGTDNKLYVCVDSPLIKGWKEASGIDEAVCYVPPQDKAPPPKPAAWSGAPVPADVVGKALGLIRRFKSIEIMIALFYNADMGEWLAVLPDQTGSAASVSYNSQGGDIPSGYFFQGTIHSHPEMRAFWSGTDLHDQRDKSGLHMVVGTHNGEVTSKKCSLFLFGQEFDATESFVFPETVPDPPEEWVCKIEAQLQKERAQRAAVEHSKKVTCMSGNKSRFIARDNKGNDFWEEASAWSCLYGAINPWETDLSFLKTALQEVEETYSKEALLFCLYGYLVQNRLPSSEEIYSFLHREDLPRIVSLGTFAA